MSILQDGSGTYTRLKIWAAAKQRVASAYRTFSHKYLDDPSYDLLFGAKYTADALNITTGFSGYMLEIRVYSLTLFTTVDVDNQLSKLLLLLIFRLGLLRKCCIETMRLLSFVHSVSGQYLPRRR